MKQYEMARRVLEVLSSEGYTQTGAKEAVKTLFQDIRDEIFEKGEARIPGIGTVKIKVLKARKSRNPRTGQTFMTKPHYILRMRFSPSLKKEVKAMPVKSDSKKKNIKK